MKSKLSSFIIIAVGIVWLLGTLDIVPPVKWLWSIALLVAGVFLTFAEKGNRTFQVIGPFLILLSGLSVLRQLEVLPIKVELPIAVIGFGILSLRAHGSSKKR